MSADINVNCEKIIWLFVSVFERVDEQKVVLKMLEMAILEMHAQMFKNF